MSDAEKIAPGELNAAKKKEKTHAENVIVATEDASGALPYRGLWAHGDRRFPLSLADLEKATELSDKKGI